MQQDPVLCEQNESRADPSEVVLHQKKGSFAVGVTVDGQFSQASRIHSDDAPRGKIRKGIQVLFANLGIEKLSII
jgi:hypothetical protein